MNLKSYKASACVRLSLLAMTCFLAACQQMSTTRTAAIETDTSIVLDLCEHAWKPQTYSSRDTEQTQLEARANNAAREAYCRG